MTPENLTRTIVWVSNPARDVPRTGIPVILGLRPRDVIQKDDGRSVTILGPGRGPRSVEVGWDDEITGLPVVSSYDKYVAI